MDLTFHTIFNHFTNINNAWFAPCHIDIEHRFRILHHCTVTYIGLYAPAYREPQTVGPQLGHAREKPVFFNKFLFLNINLPLFLFLSLLCLISKLQTNVRLRLRWYVAQPSAERAEQRSVLVELEEWNIAYALLVYSFNGRMEFICSQWECLVWMVEAHCRRFRANCIRFDKQKNGMLRNFTDFNGNIWVKQKSWWVWLELFLRNGDQLLGFDCIEEVRVRPSGSGFS